MTARDFLIAFDEAYHQVFSCASSDESVLSWFNVSHRVLWDNDSVIRLAAKALGLVVARGEPLRLDAALLAPKQNESWRRTPIKIAIEHENNASTFDQEVRVLMAVRAPLKVGITYPTRKSEVIKTIKTKIREEFDIAHENSPENGLTEYLFMIGDTDERKAAHHKWTALTFSVEEFTDPGYQLEFVTLDQVRRLYQTAVGRL